MFKNKTILVTGGTGTFGQKFAEIVLNEHHPKAIRILSRGELLQQQMRESFNDDKRLRFFIGDIRDEARLHRAMADVDIVIHAAALKIIPSCEYNPFEAVQTNILGTMNVIDIAIDNAVKKVLLISSDKSCSPSNLYGATKMVAEKLFIQGNNYRGHSATKLSAIRYGNVINSRGSVIPVFKAQKDNGMITITDERMTRFWLTIEEGVNFALNSLKIMEGGEIFIPKVKSMRIMDLADVIAPNVKRNVIGIRPGEKLHETLITKEESRYTKEFDNYYVVDPEFDYGNKLKEGKSLSENFCYSSDTTKSLSKEELREAVK